MTICEAMGGPRERLRQATPANFALDGIDPLNLVAVDIAAARGGTRHSADAGPARRVVRA